MVAFELRVESVEMKRIVNRGRSLIGRTCKSLGIAEVTASSTFYTWDGASKELGRQGLLGRLLGRNAVPTDIPPKRVTKKSPGLNGKEVTQADGGAGGVVGERVWIITDSGDHTAYKFGHVASGELPRGSVMAGERGLFRMGGSVYLAMELVEKDRVDQTVARFYKRLIGASAEAGKVPGGTGGADFRDRLRDDAGAGAAPAPKPAVHEMAADNNKDSHMIWVDIDAHGLRRKSFENSVLESCVVLYRDSSQIRGLPTTLHTIPNSSLG